SSSSDYHAVSKGVMYTGRITHPREEASTGISRTPSPASRSSTETVSSHQLETSAREPSADSEMNFGTRPTSITWSHRPEATSRRNTADGPTWSPVRPSSCAVTAAPAPGSRDWAASADLAHVVPPAGGHVQAEHRGRPHLVAVAAVVVRGHARAGALQPVLGDVGVPPVRREHRLDRGALGVPGPFGDAELGEVHLVDHGVGELEALGVVQR